MQLLAYCTIHFDLDVVAMPLIFDIDLDIMKAHQYISPSSVSVRRSQNPLSSPASLVPAARLGSRYTSTSGSNLRALLISCLSSYLMYTRYELR